MSTIINDIENINCELKNSLIDLILPSNNNFNELLLSETKEEPQQKQQIKFVLTKHNIPSDTTLLQKKTQSQNNEQYSQFGKSNNGRWDKDEQKRFAEAVLKFGNDWKKIQNHVFSRNITQIRSHAQKFLMKLKESNLLKDKGLEKSLSWTKVINYLNTILSNNE